MRLASYMLGNSTTRTSPAYGTHHPEPEDLIFARDYLVQIGAQNDFTGSIFSNILISAGDWLKVLEFVCYCAHLVLILSFIRLASILL